MRPPWLTFTSWVSALVVRCSLFCRECNVCLFFRFFPGDTDGITLDVDPPQAQPLQQNQEGGDENDIYSGFGPFAFYGRNAYIDHFQSL